MPLTLTLNLNLNLTLNLTLNLNLNLNLNEWHPADAKWKIDCRGDRADQENTIFVCNTY